MTGPELRSQRSALSLSQTALAAAIGTTSTTVSNWERGVHPIPSWAEQSLQMLAKMQEVS